MNNLVIDIGNSNIVVGQCVDNICETYRFNTDADKTSDEYYTVLKASLNDLNIDNVLISSVVPKLTSTIKLLCKKYLNIEAQIVEPGYKSSVKVITDNPKEVGSDLICGVAGAMQYSTSGIVIDMGTATKLSYYKDNTFLGVIIAPGLKISASTLTNSASQLCDFPLEKPKHIFGKNTIECMQSGIIYGHIAMLNGLVSMAFEELGETLPIYLTGGLSFIVKDDLEFKCRYDQNLIIDALNNMLIKNMEK